LQNTPDRHKSIIFDISGKPRGPDRNAWQAAEAGLWPAGRMLDTPALEDLAVNPESSRLAAGVYIEDCNICSSWSQGRLKCFQKEHLVLKIPHEQAPKVSIASHLEYR